LVRAADLIGQLGDPLYPRKLNALYHEFAEIGVNEKLGYNNPADLVDHYPHFYWSKIERYIGEALRYLDMTMEGNDGSRRSTVTSSRSSIIAGGSVRSWAVRSGKSEGQCDLPADSIFGRPRCRQSRLWVSDSDADAGCDCSTT
jgi:hypothetical protein